MTDFKFIESEVSIFCQQNDKNRIISSEKYFKFPCCLGIDEAGRGPVLGPMVYAGAYIEMRHLDRISAIGLDDSKKLKEETRLELLKQLSDYETRLCGFEVEILSPNFISNQMLNVNKTNLNTLSHNSAIGIIQRVLDKGVDLREVYLDTVGSPEKYRDLILSHFPKLKVVVESKADATYKIVSAASIFAKVIRDKCVTGWLHRESVSFPIENCGSGYPSDPATKHYLTQIFHPVFGFPQFVRSSWSTASTVMDRDCVPIEWEDSEDSSNKFSSKSDRKRSAGSNLINEKSNNKSLLEFYCPSIPIDKRHRYFTSRKFERVAAFQ